MLLRANSQALAAELRHCSRGIPLSTDAEVGAAPEPQSPVASDHPEETIAAYTAATMLITVFLQCES